MKLFKKNPQELTVGESLLYVILTMIVSVLMVPIYYGAIALVDEDTRDAVKEWFIDRWCSAKDFFSNLFTR